MELSSNISNKYRELIRRMNERRHIPAERVSSADSVKVANIIRRLLGNLGSTALMGAPAIGGLAGGMALGPLMGLAPLIPGIGGSLVGGAVGRSINPLTNAARKVQQWGEKPSPKELEKMMGKLSSFREVMEKRAISLDSAPTMDLEQLLQTITRLLGALKGVGVGISIDTTDAKRMLQGMQPEIKRLMTMLRSAFPQAANVRTGRASDIYRQLESKAQMAQGKK